jgi:hypothetical protein
MLGTMPEIEITPEQEKRLRALQEDIAQDVVGKYGHVRPCDAVEYLLDRYEADDADAEDADTTADAETNPSAGGSNGTATTVAEEGEDSDASDADEDDADDADEDDADDADEDDADDAAEDDADEDSDDDAMLNEMMSLLDTHDDKWGESSGDERYAVELPDDSTEHVRTKDDVKALLFKHYR